MKYRFLLDYVIYEKQGRPEMKEIRFEKGEVVELDIDTVYAREDKDIAIVLVRKEANIVLVPIIVMMFATERVDEIMQCAKDADSTTKNICKNNRKVAVANNTRELLRPILWYFKQQKHKHIIKIFEDICSLEERKRNDETDDDFYEIIIELLKALVFSDNARMPQFKFLTISEIRNKIIDKLKHNLSQQRRKNG